ncbi:MAG: ribosome small subunit-dependent GTPase A [Clostridiales bacterium]|nr:ribosome small subunit-dependent GTPase A [Clostridiales bacterium]
MFNVDAQQFFRVVKVSSNKYQVLVNGQIVNMIARKKIKDSGKDIIVGDWIGYIVEAGQAIIVSVMDRQNSLNRPKVANIDMCIAVIAEIPKPDYLALDKLSYNCVKQGIEYVLCINKMDIATPQFLLQLQDRFKAVCASPLRVSAKLGQIEPLLNTINGKVCCLAGQSAVGKSSIVNCLMMNECQTVGHVSAKSNRGKHTTSSSKIFNIRNGTTLVVDTPGFSLLNTMDIDANSLSKLLPEFKNYSNLCRFSTCTHTIEPCCNIINAVKEGNINKSRYDNYVTVYSDLCLKKKY